MTSEEFFEYVESRGKGAPELENKFLSLLRTVIGPSNKLSQGTMPIEEEKFELNQFPGDKLKIFLN